MVFATHGQVCALEALWWTKLGQRVRFVGSLLSLCVTMYNLELQVLSPAVSAFDFWAAPGWEVVPLCGSQPKQRNGAIWNCLPLHGACARATHLVVLFGLCSLLQLKGFVLQWVRVSRLHTFGAYSV